MVSSPSPPSIFVVAVAAVEGVVAGTAGDVVAAAQEAVFFFLAACLAQLHLLATTAPIQPARDEAGSASGFPSRGPDEEEERGRADQEREGREYSEPRHRVQEAHSGVAALVGEEPLAEALEVPRGRRATDLERERPLYRVGIG